jgi:hypothetical protein
MSVELSHGIHGKVLWFISVISVYSVAESNAVESENVTFGA